MGGAHVHVRCEISKRKRAVACCINRLDGAAHDLIVICFCLFHVLKLGSTARQSDPKIAHLALAPWGASGHTEAMAKQLDYHTIRAIFERFQAAEAEPKGELEHVNEADCD